MATNTRQALDEAREWLRKGPELKQRLQRERLELLARVREIDIALAAMPSEPKSDKAPQNVVSLPKADDYAQMSVPALVRAILSRHPEGIGAGAIIEEIRAMVPDVDVRNIHSALYRMGDIRKEGTKGAKTYYPMEAAAE